MYNLKRFYITPKVTTWKIYVEYIKKEIRRGLIHITTKKKISEIGGKAIRDERRDEKATRHMEYNEQTGSKVHPINNYLKCKWIKLPKIHRFAE